MPNDAPEAELHLTDEQYRSKTLQWLETARDVVFAWMQEHGVAKIEMPFEGFGDEGQFEEPIGEAELAERAAIHDQTRARMEAHAREAMLKGMYRLIPRTTSAERATVEAAQDITRITLSNGAGEKHTQDVPKRWLIDAVTQVSPDREFIYQPNAGSDALVRRELADGTLQFTCGEFVPDPKDRTTRFAHLTHLSE